MSGASGKRTIQMLHEQGVLPPSRSALNGKVSAYDAVDLLEESFEPVRWIIPDILPEGLTLFGAAPKLGKTMTALAVSLRYAIYSIDGVAHQVLYMSLDDISKRRLQQRIRDLLGGDDLPRERLFYCLRAPHIDDGLVDALRHWLTSHPNLRLIVIDVYAAVKPKSKGHDVYVSDYEALCQLREFAVEAQIAVLIIHHTRKRIDTFDWASNFSGSNGLMGAVDTLWMLERKRGASSMQLHVTGRDIEQDIKVALDLGALDAVWQPEPEDMSSRAKMLASPIVVTALEQRILEVLSQTDSPKGPMQIAQEAGLQDQYPTIKVLIRRMLTKGYIRQTSRGSYLIAPDRAEAISNNTG